MCKSEIWILCDVHAGLTVSRAMSVIKTWIRCLPVMVTVCLLLKETAAVSLEIRTKECKRFIEGSVEILGKYQSTPGGPVDWQRPDRSSIGICIPNGSCLLSETGYSVSQSASGLDYKLLILAARDVDEGLWQISDGVASLNTSLNFTENPSAVHVSCSVTNRRYGYTKSVTCTTECVKDDLDLAYFFQAGLRSPPTKNTSCTGGAQYSSTVTFNSSYTGGSHELCYVLFNGDCNHTQTDSCQSVTLPYPQDPCPRPCCVFTGFAVLAGVLLVACVILLPIVIKRGSKGIYRSVVIGTLIAAVVLAVLAITLLTVSLVITGCDSECRNLRQSESAEPLGIAGIVFSAFGLVAFIAAVIMYYGVMLKVAGKRTETKIEVQ